MSTAQIGTNTAATRAALTDGTTFAVGNRMVDHNGNHWVYVHAEGAIGQYDFVGIDENYEAGALTTAMADDGWMIGVAQVAFADNEYGWVCERGTNINGAVLASAAADVALYTSGTAGSLDDATTTTKIDGVVAVAAVGTAAGNVEIIATYPRSAGF